MSNFIVIQTVKLEPLRHRRTGKTRHVRGGRELVALPHELRIEKCRNADGSIGYYLLHYNVQNEELTDTYHDRLEQAMKQAEWEFGVQPNDWQRT